jgi:hypothetical protein
LEIRKNVDVAEILPDALTKNANVVILGEINGTSVAMRAERLDLFRDVFQEFAAARYQANLGTVAGQGKSNRFADAAAGAGHYGNLVLQTFHDFCRDPPLANDPNYSLQNTIGTAARREATPVR